MVQVWTVISGSGTAVVDGVARRVGPGDIVAMPALSCHTVVAGDAGLRLIEVQVGKDIDVSDKVKYPFPEI